MKGPNNLLSFIMVAALLSACGQVDVPAESIREGISISQGQAILLEIDSGEVTLIGGGQTGMVQVNGQLLDPQRIAYSVSSFKEQIVISVPVQHRPLVGFSSSPVILTLDVPDGTPIIINTFDANVTVSDFQGELQVASIAGDILAEDVYGKASLVSGRGNVTIRRSSGKLRILGEHGILTLQEISGEIGSSTIMGTIRYEGQPTPGDTIHLEVDHGPVEIFLPQDSNLEVEIRSNSGDVTCIAPGVRVSGRTCTGKLGAGDASLTVRTVSGNITLRVSP